MMQYPSIQYQPDAEAVHIIRTVHPDEHPLLVRDEMMKSSARLKKRAEETDGPSRGACQRIHMFLHLVEVAAVVSCNFNSHKCSFRWYFQPCTHLGGLDSSDSASTKIQSIPAYIELEGYCTDDDDESDDRRSVGQCDDEYDDVSDDAEEDRDIESSSNEISTINTRQLKKEKRRIAVLRELSNSPFVVSGYLLKRSQKDPNVWRRMYCVLSNDRLWVIGRVKLLSDFSCDDVDVNTNQDVLSSMTMRIGSHSYINLLRSILMQRDEPVCHRLPNSFRIVTSSGKTHSFRAFNSQSFQSWIAALSEKIAQTHSDGLMDLAHLIMEEETLARCRRMEDIAVAPFLRGVSTPTEVNALSMDIVRFAMSVAEYRELCRKVDEAMQLHKNSGRVLNVQTRVAESPRSKANKGLSASLSAGYRARNEAMVSSVWEDARVVANKSAQLLHSIATSQHSILEAVTELEDAKEEKGEFASSIKDLIDEQKYIQTLLSKRWRQQLTPEDDSDVNEMDHLPPSRLFDKLLERFHSVSLTNKRTIQS